MGAAEHLARCSRLNTLPAGLGVLTRLHTLDLTEEQVQGLRGRLHLRPPAPAEPMQGLQASKG